MKSIITPTSPGQRIDMLDVLRGFAIFGILMVNMHIFYQPMTRMLLGYTGTEPLLNITGEQLVKFFFEGKFYVLFSMLFGYGFWLFINRSSGDGNSIIPTYRLRVFFLFLFGVAHVVLLWAGDILLFYALFGFLLILFRKVTDRGLVKWAVWLALIPGILTLFFAMLITLASLHPESKAAVDASMQAQTNAVKTLIDQSAEAYTHGSFNEIMVARLREYQAMLPGMVFFYPTVLAMFLIGVWAARKQLIQNYREHLPFFRKTLLWGIIIGIPANLLFAYAYTRAPASEMGFWSFISTLTHTAGGITFSLLYVSAIILLSAKGKLFWFRRNLAPVGRMALTNYLMHSIICTTIFLSYGLGLFGKFNAWEGMLLALIIFGLQIPFSKFWLKYYHYGPFEWLWRSLTYLQWQPFRKSLP